jgi:hypothetical protein
LGAPPVDAVAASGDPDAGELVGDEPVAELRVVVVEVVAALMRWASSQSRC